MFVYYGSIFIMCTLIRSNTNFKLAYMPVCFIEYPNYTQNYVFLA
jgi:hypothetical protein